MGKKKIKWGMTVIKALLVQIVGFAAVFYLTYLTFIYSPEIEWKGEPVNPILLIPIVFITGILSVKYIVPSIFKLKCPKCKKKSVKADVTMSLSLHCKNCGAEKYTWIN